MSWLFTSMCLYTCTHKPLRQQHNFKQETKKVRGISSKGNILMKKVILSIFVPETGN